MSDRELRAAVAAAAVCGQLPRRPAESAHAYLRHVIGSIAGHPVNRVAGLLPWNIATSALTHAVTLNQ